MRVELEGVGFSYPAGDAPGGRRRALDGVNLAVESGQVLGVMGKTGAGKTTLLEILAAVCAPEKGRLLVDGHDIWKDAAARRAFQAQVGLCFQLPERQFFSATVEEEVGFTLRCLRKNKAQVEAASRRALATFGLDFDAVRARSPFSLSGGQQRRVALASVLAAGPEVLILDEPTAGLDPEVRCDCLSAIQACARAGCAVVMASHDADAVAHVCDEVAVIEGGRVAARGCVRDLLGDAARMQALGLDGCYPAKAAAALAAHGICLDQPVISAEELADALAQRLASAAAPASAPAPAPAPAESAAPGGDPR